MTSGLAIALLCLAIFLATLRFRRGDRSESSSVLRHTITVNLEILEAELSELQAIAFATARSQARQTASELLQEAQLTAILARKRLWLASPKELQELLGLVFEAMNQSTEARRLFNAQTPRR